MARVAALRPRRQNASAATGGSAVEPSPLAIYQNHLDRGELAYQWSPAAGRAVFYPRLVCPFGGSTALEWRIASGLGTVYATTVTYPFQGEGHNIVLIDCDEGFRLMSRVEDIDPIAVKIGMRVRFPVHPAEGDQPAYPVFVPLEGAP